jgi:hypothetical protein
VDNGSVIIVIVLVALPVAAIVFAMSAGKAFDQIGKGPLSIEPDSDRGEGGGSSGPPISPAQREAEIRQMIEARSYRREARGEAALDIDAEVSKQLAASPPAGGDAALRDEVRQLVVARNERRVRRGEPGLDVEAEIDRQLRDLEGLGQ